MSSFSWTVPKKRLFNLFLSFFHSLHHISKNLLMLYFELAEWHKSKLLQATLISLFVYFIILTKWNEKKDYT